MSLSTEVKGLLTSIDNVYIGTLPPTIDNCIAFFYTGGLPRGLTESKLKQPTFQIRVRNTSYSAAETLCDTIDDILHGHTDANILLIRAMGDKIPIGRDANNRQEFTMNYKSYYR